MWPCRAAGGDADCACGSRRPLRPLAGSCCEWFGHSVYCNTNPTFCDVTSREAPSCSRSSATEASAELLAAHSPPQRSGSLRE
eukprot:3621502-Prymnesium_polylepis.1